ncbi:MAG: hypothetical protein AVDCRST_MAG60-436, partial [uncultured Nocardioides sp.]
VVERPDHRCCRDPQRARGPPLCRGCRRPGDPARSAAGPGDLRRRARAQL